MNKSNQIKLKKPNKLSAFFICLLISILLWLLHSLNTVYTKQFTIPVRFLNTPQEKQLIGLLPNSIKLNIKASGLKLLFLQLQEPFSILDLNFNQLKSDEQKNKFYISDALVKIKQHLNVKAEIKRIIPDTLFFSDKLGAHKEVFVKVPLTLNFAQGYSAQQIITIPERVIINGDEADLKNIDTIYTIPLYLNDINKNIERIISINKPNQSVVLNTSNVKVKINTQKLAEKTLTLKIEIKSSEAKDKYTVFPGKVKIKLIIGENKLTAIDSLHIKAIVDINAKKQNKLPINIVGLPDFVTLVSYEPKEVEFLILKK